jgi:predicted ester cyclase
MSEENRAVWRRFVEKVLNQGNLSAIDDLIAADYVGHGSDGVDTIGPEGVRGFIRLFHTAFPDVHYTLEDQIAAGDKVLNRATIRGTHRGEFMGVAPTGRPVVVQAVAIARIADGKVVEEWLHFDRWHLMEQLGVVPPFGQAGRLVR